MNMSTIEPSKFIGTKLFLRVKDGRSLQGILTVIDPFGNLLMNNVVETSKDKLNYQENHERELGLVSVPRDEIVQVLMEKKIYSQIV
ncbi:Piso0_000551 [Millerozyma farinosa CBS 7064]|uniref:Piso0_000551 protein n=1 Tax=Pichia sorbitophila (strain ATCC MYA-4447 / BCRC 22081 / CBS 7064 / NBRC 10061 / NRRL Y-12695) TaxID=559304 RepID=G8YSP3_PICSO|nr:Piso0_000551 [Millerozyma farinosa CBS 7064]CCE73505.1 Piso0_000551 [Millerozyma farinosa CBS 7064]